MLVEMRTYSFRPGFLGRALDKIALGVAERTTLSPLGGLWYSDIGRRHQIVHLWPYESLAHRESVRGRFGGLKNWPARTTDFTAESETKILSPAPFSPPLAPRKAGPVYEICTDTCRPDKLKELPDLWAARIEGRMKLAPLIGAWQTTLGPMYQWIHIWAYESLARRAEVQKEAAARRVWPPEEDPDEWYLRQDCGIYFPAAFSPLQ